MERENTNAVENEKLRLWRLFILGRSAVTGVFWILLALIDGFWPPYPLRPLLILAGAQFFSNALYLYLWKRRDIAFLGFLSFSLEIVLISLMAYFLGPDGHAFVLAYLWPIIMGGWLIGRQAIPPLTALSAIAYATRVLLERRGWAITERILAPAGMPLALVLTLPYLAFISLLVWLLTTEMENREENLLNAVSENAHLLQRLKRERNLLRDILTNMAEGVLVTDGTGKVLLANRAATALLHVHEGENLSPWLLSQVSGEKGEEASDNRRIVEFEGRTISLSSAELSGGYEMRASLLAEPTVASNGRAQPNEQVAPEPSVTQVGAKPLSIYVARDITHEAQVERMKSDFVAYVSHELRTPLTTIKMLVRLLLMDTVKETKAYEYLSIVNTQVERQARLINNLLDITRLEAGKYDLPPEPADPRRVVQNAFGACRPLIEEKQLRVEISYADGIPETFISNNNGLEQVLINLLSNAVKFTPKGGLISISCRSDGETICFAVRDSGVGMTPEQLGRIFTKFYTVHYPRKKGEGTGLGLVISDMIIKKLGGRINVTSQVNVGSCFEVYLPIKGLPPTKATVPAEAQSVVAQIP